MEKYVSLRGFKQGQIGGGHQRVHNGLSGLTLDQILKDLIETNIRQRGDVGGSAKKVGLRIKELERLYGIQNGGDRGNQYRTAEPNNSELANQKQLEVCRCKCNWNRKILFNC